MNPRFTIPAAGTRVLGAVIAAVAVLAAALVFEAPRSASAEHPEETERPGECEVIDLGMLSASGDGELEATGTWTNEGCDSAHLPDTDAYTYRFELPVTTWVHIDLSSTGADSFLHLLTADGGLIAHDDDGGPGLDARIETQLEAGSYLVEAARGDGRFRGPADFALLVFITGACEPVDLGTLEPGVTLSAEGVWEHDDCGARYREDAPAHTYRFELLEEGSVRIDLMSDDGDPYVYLLAPDGSYIYSDDDGGDGRDSRIDADLPAGSYVIEATTYYDRESVLSSAPFTVTVVLVDESRFAAKVEAVHAPDTVIAGERFAIHYRVGNLGDLDVPTDETKVLVYATGSGYAFDWTGHVPVGEGQWQAGASYHSGAETASGMSTRLRGLGPLSLTIRRPGDAWLSVGVVTEDADDVEIGRHRVWRPVTVLSGPTFEATIVSVDGAEHLVHPVVLSSRIVRYDVYDLADPAARVDAATSAKAIFTAATHRLMLDGLFERPAVALLGAELLAREGLEPEPLDIRSPASTGLLQGFAWHYLGQLAGSGLAASVAVGNVVTPAEIEELALASGDGILAHVAPMHAFWTAASDRVNEGGSLTFEDALRIQSELAYAETRGAPLATAARAVRAARASDAGWADPAARAMLGGIAAQARCEGAPTLGDALAAVVAAGAIEAGNIAAMLALDALLREALPAHALATDAALCAIAGIDAENATLLGQLSIAGSEVHAMIAPAPPPPPPPEPLRVRIVARLAEDGRIEHAVALGGRLVLPDRRFLDADAPVGSWRSTSAVELGGASIGRIRARHLADGRIEIGFVDPDGNTVTPDVRYLPAELPPAVWLRSSAFELPPPAPPEG